MRTYRFNPTIADAYGQGTYGGCTYNQSSACSTSASTNGASSTSGSTGTLADTGIVLIAIVTIACVLIFVGLLVRFWRRPVKTSESEAKDTVS